MKQITNNEIKEIQLSILQDIADFCESNGITYFLAYGTLIGAIRHNGFIPWDDDIDIAMPRQDYEIFLKEYNRRKSSIRVIHFSNDSDYGVPFAKVYDNRTWLNEFKYRKDKYGVFVDVFPVDGVKGKWQVFVATKLDKLLHVKKANFVQRSFFHNVGICIAKFFLLPFSMSSILKFSDKNAKKYPFGTTEEAGILLETYGESEVVDTTVFENTIFHEFEGKQYRIPIGYDRWLRSMYGDYMQLPPKEKQVNHHIFNAYWIEDINR